MSKVINSTQPEFEKEVLKSKIPVLVDFWAPWCGPCRMMAPVLDELSDERAGKLKIVKIDIENPQNRDLAMQYQIRSIPNMKVFKGGEAIADIVGFRPKDQLVAEIDEALG